MKKWVMTGWVTMVLSILLAVNTSFAGQRSRGLPAWRYYDGGYFKKDAGRRPHFGKGRHAGTRDRKAYLGQKRAHERRRYGSYPHNKRFKYDGRRNPYGRPYGKPHYGREKHYERRLPGGGFNRSPGTYHLGGMVVRPSWSFGFSLGVPPSRPGRYGHR